MPTEPIVPPPTPDGGDLVVHDEQDVLALLPVEVRRSLSAPVRDALARALTEILKAYESRATQGASLGDVLATTGISLDGIGSDYDRYRKDGEDDSTLRARILSLDAMVTPEALIAAVNAILSVYTELTARYFESEADSWFVHDAEDDYAWDSFVFERAAGAAPRYPDRLYVDDAAENADVFIPERLPPGAWANADRLGRYFILRIPDVVPDPDLVALVAVVELLKGEGMRWQLLVEDEDAFAAATGLAEDFLGMLGRDSLGGLTLGG